MKNLLLTTILSTALAMPLFASAQVGITTDTGATVTVEQGTTTQAHIFTACSQASIETRDSFIASARSVYNEEMAKALDARKEAEKAAVAILDVDAKKDAIQVAVEAYKKAVTKAQNNLTESRKDAWAGFEKDTEECHRFKTDAKAALTAEKKSFVANKIEEKKEVVAEKKAEVQTMQANMRVAVDAKQAEIKTFREVLKEQISALRAFFSKKPALDASVDGAISQ
jgi:hypothetical protein